MFFVHVSSRRQIACQQSLRKKQKTEREAARPNAATTRRKCLFPSRLSCKASVSDNRPPPSPVPWSGPARRRRGAGVEPPATVVRFGLGLLGSVASSSNGRAIKEPFGARTEQAPPPRAPRTVTAGSRPRRGVHQAREQAPTREETERKRCCLHRCISF